MQVLLSVGRHLRIERGAGPGGAIGMAATMLPRLRSAWTFTVLALIPACMLCACSSSSSSPKSHSSSSSDSYNAAVLARHPVGFWSMSAASVTERDLTGNGYSGLYHGGVPLVTRMPDGSEAAEFNGDGQYLSVPSTPSFSIAHTGKLTWEAWIRPDTLQFGPASDPHDFGYVDWMGKCEGYSGSCEWESRMYSSVNRQHRCNRLSAYVFNLTAGKGSGADWQPACGAMPTGRWLYVVGEYDAQNAPSPCDTAYPGTINIWVDGIKQNFERHAPTGCFSQYRIVPRSANSPLNIGTMALDTWFPGAIGKVAIYDTLLTQAEIAAHYQAMTGSPPNGSCDKVCTLASWS